MVISLLLFFFAREINAMNAFHFSSLLLLYRFACCISLGHLLLLFLF